MVAYWDSRDSIIRGVRNAPRRIMEPPNGRWTSPSNYEGFSTDLFMCGEVARTYSEGHGVRLVTTRDPYVLVPLTSSHITTFEDRVASAAVTGLHGCTSVVIISRRGVWLTHIWECPSFIGRGKLCHALLLSLGLFTCPRKKITRRLLIAHIP